MDDDDLLDFFVALISCLISQQTNLSSTGFTIKGRAVNISLRIY